MRYYVKRHYIRTGKEEAVTDGNGDLVTFRSRDDARDAIAARMIEGNTAALARYEICPLRQEQRLKMGA